MIDPRYLAGPWNNDACKGYAIMAMRSADLDEETIQKVSKAMTWAFDGVTVDEAADYYRKGTVL